MKNVQLREELKKAAEEIQRLKEMLSQTTNNFNSLQMQLVAVMRQQEDHHHLVSNSIVYILIFLFNKHLKKNIHMIKLVPSLFS